MTHRIKASAFWRIAALALSLTLVFSLAACSDGEEGTASEEDVEQSTIVLASTTSTQDSGLFDVLIPAFEEAYSEYVVDVVAVGTGEALALGESKDADCLLVHATASEEEFVANGYGEYRKDVMYNDFIIVGPESDPAGVAGMDDAAEALTMISEAGEIFISRGDDSGTHKKELSLWAATGFEPNGPWYRSAGQGMGDCLAMANQELGYVMTDRATYLNLQDTLDLVILVEGDPLMFNQYGVLPVTDATNIDGAEAFADWITTDGQAVIETYGVEKFGAPLFVPNAS